MPGHARTCHVEPEHVEAMSISVKLRIAEFERLQQQDIPQQQLKAWSQPRSTQTVGAHEMRAIGLSGIHLFANRNECVDMRKQRASFRRAGSTSSKASDGAGPAGDGVADVSWSVTATKDERYSEHTVSWCEPNPIFEIDSAASVKWHVNAMYDGEVSLPCGTEESCSDEQECMSTAPDGAWESGSVHSEAGLSSSGYGMEYAQSSTADVSSHIKVKDDEGNACSGVRKASKAWERRWHACVLYDGRVYPFDPGGPTTMMLWGWHGTLMMAGCAA